MAQQLFGSNVEGGTETLVAPGGVNLLTTHPLYLSKYMEDVVGGKPFSLFTKRSVMGFALKVNT